MNIFFIVYLIVINVVAFSLYAIDKRRAVNHQTRIPESVLLWLARLGGGIGCILAMYILHHKKKKPKFIFRVPIWIIVWMFIVILFIVNGDSNGTTLIDEFKTLK